MDCDGLRAEKAAGVPESAGCASPSLVSQRQPTSRPASKPRYADERAAFALPTPLAQPAELGLGTAATCSKRGWNEAFQGGPSSSSAGHYDGRRCPPRYAGEKQCRTGIKDEDPSSSDVVPPQLRQSPPPAFVVSGRVASVVAGTPGISSPATASVHRFSEGSARPVQAAPPVTCCRIASGRLVTGAVPQAAREASTSAAGVAAASTTASSSLQPSTLSVAAGTGSLGPCSSPGGQRTEAWRRQSSSLLLRRWQGSSIAVGATESCPVTAGSDPTAHCATALQTAAGSGSSNGSGSASDACLQCIAGPTRMSGEAGSIGGAGSDGDGAVDVKRKACDGISSGDGSGRVAPRTHDIRTSGAACRCEDAAAPGIPLVERSNDGTRSAEDALMQRPGGPQQPTRVRNGDSSAGCLQTQDGAPFDGAAALSVPLSAAACRPDIVPAGAADKTISAQLGAALPPEMAARLRKKIIIIQPISRTWVEETLQSSNGTGNASGTSGSALTGGTCAPPATPGDTKAAGKGPPAENTVETHDAPSVQLEQLRQVTHSVPKEEMGGPALHCGAGGKGRGWAPGQAAPGGEGAAAVPGCEGAAGSPLGGARAAVQPSGGRLLPQAVVGGDTASPQASKLRDDPRPPAALSAPGQALPLPQILGSAQILPGSAAKLHALTKLVGAAKVTGGGGAAASGVAAAAASASLARQQQQQPTFAPPPLAASTPAVATVTAALTADGASPFNLSLLALLAPALPASSAAATMTGGAGVMLPPRHGSSASTGVPAAAGTAIGISAGPAVPDPSPFGSLVLLPGMGSGVMPRSMSLDELLQIAPAASAAAAVGTHRGSGLPRSLAGGGGGGGTAGGGGASSLVTAGASPGGMQPCNAGGAAGYATDARSQASHWAAPGLVAQPQPQPQSSACLGRVQGELSLLYQWYVANKNVYLDQAQRQLQRVEALTAVAEAEADAAAGAGAGGGLDAAAAAAAVRAESAEAMRAFETALKIMRVCGSVEQQWLAPPPPQASAAAAAAAATATVTGVPPGRGDRQDPRGGSRCVTSSGPSGEPTDLAGATAAAAPPEGLRGVQQGAADGLLGSSVLPAAVPAPVPSNGWPHGPGAALAVAAALVGSVTRHSPQHGTGVQQGA